MSYEEIRKGLASYHPIEKRWEAEKINGFNVINDSYNANPESMKASVSTFLDLYEKPIVILGDMGELGDNEIELHRQVGRYLAQKEAENKNKAVFITVGSLAENIGEELKKAGLDVYSFKNNDETSRYILDNLDVGNTIFLKASRAMKFEEIIENLKLIKRG